jgi:hypothetical protein
MAAIMETIALNTKQVVEEAELKTNDEGEISRGGDGWENPSYYGKSIEVAGDLVLNPLLHRL